MDLFLVAVECLQFSVDYAEKAFKKCKAAGTRKIERSKCSMLQDAIESYIDNMVRDPLQS